MPLPERIGRYRVTGELGRGAMGTVYRGRDDALDREVALKVMSQGVADADARARFSKEAKAAARLQHPNIVVIYELGEHAGAPYMALELLEGVDLQHAIAGGIRPDPRATLPLVLQLLAGLGHAHDHGIVHRDVKPSNLFLPYGKPAKIMDFGVARLSGQGTTTAGTIVGTPNYMSPEQVSGGELDGRSDLFSSGLILFELVTGEKAIRADTVVSAMYKILHESADLSLIPGEPAWRRLRGVLERVLARRPEDRFPDARAMSTELAQALVDLGGTADWTAPSDQALLTRPKPAAPRATAPAARAEVGSRGAPATAPSPRARQEPVPKATRPLAWLALVGAGVLAVLAVAGTLWLRPGRSAPDSQAPRAAAPSTTVAAASPALPAASASPQALAARPAATPRAASPSPPPAPAAEPGGSTPRAAAGLAPAARLARARELLARQRWGDALAEARAVLEAEPTSREASGLAERAEAELVVEECLRNARAALRAGDRERAIDELRRGFLVRKDDARLLALHREAVQQ